MERIEVEFFFFFSPLDTVSINNPSLFFRLPSAPKFAALGSFRKLFFPGRLGAPRGSLRDLFIRWLCVAWPSESCGAAGTDLKNSRILCLESHMTGPPI